MKQLIHSALRLAEENWSQTSRGLLVGMSYAAKVGSINDLRNSDIDTSVFQMISELFDVIHLICNIPTTMYKMYRTPDLCQDISWMGPPVNKKFHGKSVEAFQLLFRFPF